MRKSNTLLATIMPLLAAGSGLHAEGAWTLGAIIVGETGYYVGQKDEVALVPYISFETERFEFSLHDGVAYHAFQGDGPNGSAARLSFVLTPRWEPDFSDDPVFDGLDRDTAFEVGMRGAYARGLFFAEAEALADVSDTHNGYEASAAVGLQYEAGAFRLEGGVGARYRSGDLNQHLFGVSASEAGATRAAFTPGDSTTGFASVTAAYALNDNVALVGDITFEDFGNMQASPLVGKGSTTSLALGLIYQF